MEWDVSSENYYGRSWWFVLLSVTYCFLYTYLLVCLAHHQPESTAFHFLIFNYVNLLLNMYFLLFNLLISLLCIPRISSHK